MLKIVVFDGGWGGEVIANYLGQELQVMDILRVIDWDNAPYEEKDSEEICRLAEVALKDYFGKVDLIVLGGYSAALALEYLRQKYPQQKFVAVGVNYHRVLKTHHYPNRITIIINNSPLEAFKQEFQTNLPYSHLSIPDSMGWEELTNSGEFSMETMRADLNGYFHLRPVKYGKNNPRPNLHDLYHTAEIWPLEDRIKSDVVLLLNTNLWDRREEIETLFGYNVRVMDFRQKLLHDVCVALNLLGTDGCRAK